MNWEAIGAVGEIVGALAVVVSLAYLAVQIRVQNKETRFSAMHDISVGYRDSMANFADETIATLVDKAITDYDSLTQIESIQIIAVVGRILRVWEEAFIQHEAGRLEERTWESMLKQFHGYMSLIPFEKVWEIRREYFDPEFSRFVDGLKKTEYRFK